MFLDLTATNAQTSVPLVLGMDHIPIVVRDLKRAEQDFRAMGFSIKTGRLHEDGIRNVHIKFRDGTELELITATKRNDSLTAEYLARMSAGDGPVYFGLYAPASMPLARELKELGFAVQTEGSLFDFPPESKLHPLFFGDRNKSPTDRPEHFAHINSADRLSAVWVRDNPDLYTLFRGLGMTTAPAPVCAPIQEPGIRVVRLPEGDVYLMPSAPENVVAARVEVQSIENVKSILRKNRVPVQQRIGCDPNALWIAPANAHGIWIEFVGPLQ